MFEVEAAELLDPAEPLAECVGMGVEQPGGADDVAPPLQVDVERVEQRYARVDNHGTSTQYDYRAPTFEFEARLVFDETGLVLDYPGLARRVL